MFNKRQPIDTWTAITMVEQVRTVF